MQLVLETGNDTEVTASTAKPPEKVVVFRFTGMQLLAIGGNDVHAKQVVDGHAILSA